MSDLNSPREVMHHHQSNRLQRIHPNADDRGSFVPWPDELLLLLKSRQACG
jgi:hypothetical protein